MTVKAPDILAFLAELEAFARAYPSVGAHLSAGPTDPDVERLLEGIAFSASRVTELVRVGSGARMHGFAETLCPEVLRPFPCATFLEMVPGPAFGTMARTVPAGFEVESDAVDGTRCRFRSFAPLPLVPFRADGARLVWSADAGQELVLTLRTTAMRAAALGRLQLHVGGDPRSAAGLAAWMLLHLEGIVVRTHEGVTKTLPPTFVTRAGVGVESALLPPERHDHAGLRLLREYLLLPGRLSLLTLDLTSLALETERAELAFRFRRPLPAQTPIAADALRINCGPVLNVFASSAEPVRPTTDSASQVLRAIDGGPIYAIRRARAVPSRSRTSIALPPVSEAGAEPAPFGIAYETFVVGDHLRVSVRPARDGAPAPELAALSFDLWATNGARPQALGVGAVRHPASGVPAHVSVRNVSAMTPFRPSPQHEALRFRLLAWLALSGRPLATTDAVRTALQVFDLHAAGTEAGARRAAARRAGVLSFAVQPETCTVPALGVRQGHGIDVRLHGSGFEGEGDVLTFATVLDALFAHEASLGRYIRLRMASATSDLAYDFPPRNGAAVLE